LGRDIALRVAENGADVVIGARRLNLCETIADEVRDRGRRALPIELDVQDPGSCLAAAAAAIDTFGTIDVLVNNAAHFGDFSRFLDADLAEWRATFEVNLWGTLQLTQVVARAMRDRGTGRIININSMSAVNVEERLGAYTGSKGALAAVTKTLARELGRFGIRVNGLHAGYIWGPRLEEHFRIVAAHRGVTFEEQCEHAARFSALGYVPSSSEIAGTIVFLASNLSDPITGQALHVNAGHFMP
jgi:NAD(P)-dependent dehydrogenase (short-subunit alcohol dehydrogenase family)